MADVDKQAETQPMTEEDIDKKLYELVKEKFGESAPDAEQVAKWKEQCGRVRFVPLNDDEVYFIRPIKRAEYKGLVEATMSAKTDPEAFMRERVVARCILWPKLDPEQFADTLAGTVETLYQSVMDLSNFVTQDQLATMVRDL